MVFLSNRAVPNLPVLAAVERLVSISLQAAEQISVDLVF
jgi:hypothetical protein